MAPNAQDEKKWDPPCADTPEKYGQTFEKGGQVSQWVAFQMRDEQGSSQGGYSYRSHIDPVGSFQLCSFQRHKYKSVENQRDQNEIQQATGHKEGD